MLLFLRISMLYLDLKYNFCTVVEQITSTFKYVSPRIIIDRRACACLDTSRAARELRRWDLHKV